MCACKRRGSRARLRRSRRRRRLHPLHTLHMLHLLGCHIHVGRVHRKGWRIGCGHEVRWEVTRRNWDIRTICRPRIRGLILRHCSSKILSAMFAKIAERIDAKVGR